MATPPISPGDVVRRSAEILRAQFALLYPVALAFGLVQAMASYALIDTDAAVLAAVVSIVSNTLLVGVVVVAVHEAETGRALAEPSAGGLVRTVAPMADKLLLVVLATFVGTVGGLFLVIVPGIFLMTIWAVAAPVVVIERTGSFAALARSRDLVAPAWRPVLLTLLLVALLLLPGALVALGAPTVGQVGGAFVQVLFGALATVVAGIVSTTLYHRLLAAEAERPRSTAGGGDAGDHGAWRGDGDGSGHDPGPTGDSRPDDRAAADAEDAGGGRRRPAAREDADPVSVWSGGSRTGGPAEAPEDEPPAGGTPS